MQTPGASWTLPTHSTTPVAGSNDALFPKTRKNQPLPMFCLLRLAYLLPALIGGICAETPIGPANEQEVAVPTAEEPWGREDAELTRLATEIMGQIESLRGLAFRSQVAARYADRAAFLRYVEAMEQAMDSPERRAAEPWVAQMLGWIPVGMDLRKVQREVLASQVGGFYDPVRKTFFVMEGLHPDLIRILMAHELAHALDDQHYDLLATDRRLTDRTDALLAHHAVIEGCAQVVMTRWVSEHVPTLDPKALQEYQQQIDWKVLEAAPRYLWQPLFGLYGRGQAFLAAGSGGGALGLARVEDLEKAYRDLPRSMEQVLHPSKYWQADQREEPLRVEQRSADLPAGWQQVYADTLGELLVALCTQSQTRKLGPLALLGLRYTHDAARGWAGDRIGLWQREEARVLVWDLFWDTPRDAQEFCDALSQVEVEESSIGRAIERPGESQVRWVAWSGTPREVALKVAAGVRCSTSPWGKIPDRSPRSPEGTEGPSQTPPQDREPH